MEWTALAATVVGAVIGVGSTLVTDRVSWRRDTRERDRETLRTGRLLLYRDAVVAGHLRDDPECTQARRTFREARQKLMTAMRSSLAPAEATRTRAVQE
ncbi:hypothetical protein [Streptomyces sindenensis]|uniref:Secreted protein n=1 Tax=Streptomyces sindenensis TaxID=67363 RepID=A0ABW6EP65_9ACTN